MTQWLLTHTTFAENLNSITSMHVGQLTITYNSNSSVVIYCVPQ